MLDQADGMLDQGSPLALEAVPGFVPDTTPGSPSYDLDSLLLLAQSAPAHELANIAVAARYEGVTDGSVFDAVEARTLDLLAELSFTDISRILWSMIASPHAHTTLFEAAIPAGVYHMTERRDQLSPKAVAIWLDTYAFKQHASQPLFEAAAEAIASGMRNAPPTLLARYAYTFSQTPYRSPRMFSAVSSALYPKLHKLDPAGVLWLVAGFTRCRFHAPGIFAALGRTLSTSLVAQFRTIDVVRTLSAFATGGYPIPGTLLRRAKKIRWAHLPAMVLASTLRALVPPTRAYIPGDATTHHQAPVADAITSLPPTEVVALLRPILLALVRRPPHEWTHCDQATWSALAWAMLTLANAVKATNAVSTAVSSSDSPSAAPGAVSRPEQLPVTTLAKICDSVTKRFTAMASHASLSRLTTAVAVAAAFSRPAQHLLNVTAREAKKRKRQLSLDDAIVLRDSYRTLKHPGVLFFENFIEKRQGPAVTVAATAATEGEPTEPAATSAPSAEAAEGDSFSEHQYLLPDEAQSDSAHERATGPLARGQKHERRKHLPPASTPFLYGASAHASSLTAKASSEQSADDDGPIAVAATGEAPIAIRGTTAHTVNMLASLAVSGRRLSDHDAAAVRNSIRERAGKLKPADVSQVLSSYGTLKWDTSELLGGLRRLVDQHADNATTKNDLVHLVQAAVALTDAGDKTPHTIRRVAAAVSKHRKIVLAPNDLVNFLRACTKTGVAVPDLIDRVTREVEQRPSAFQARAKELASVLDAELAKSERAVPKERRMQLRPVNRTVDDREQAE